MLDGTKSRTFVAHRSARRRNAPLQLERKPLACEAWNARLLGYMGPSGATLRKLLHALARFVDWKISTGCFAPIELLLRHPAAIFASTFSARNAIVGRRPYVMTFRAIEILSHGVTLTYWPSRSGHLAKSHRQRQRWKS